jgi:transcriptional regulator GlxA family with amidase domain
MASVGARDSPSRSLPVNFGVALFPGFQAIDVFGPIDAFNLMSWSYEMNLSILAETLDPVTTLTKAANKSSHFFETVNPTHTFDDAPPIEVLLVPGGLGTFDDTVNPTIEFVRKTYPKLRYLITVCTGSGVAARAGVLDGKRATTNKATWQSIVALGPNTNWIPHARWVVDGNVWTSSGVSAGIDAAFDFIKHVYGNETATNIANSMEYERHQNPDWDPFAAIYNVGGEQGHK